MPTIADASSQRIYGELIAVSVDDPRAFVARALEVLIQEWDLVSASLFLFTPDAGTLRLKAQVGFSYADYKHFEFPQDSFPGLAVARREPITCADPASSPHLVNKIHLSRHSDITGVVSVPLILPAAGGSPSVALSAPDPMGAMSLYPRGAVNLDELAGRAFTLAPFLSMLYIATLERHAMSFSRDAVAKVAYSLDLTDLASSFADLLKSELSVQAVSLWLVDPRRNQLYLKYPGVEDAAMHPLSLSDSGSPDPVARCFHRGTSLFHAPAHEVLGTALNTQGLPTPLQNAALIPIRLPSTTRLSGRALPAAGVLGLFNHYTAYGGSDHATDFSWEDRRLAEFACDMVSVVIYQVLRTRDYESDFERLMHGVRTNLQAARSRLQFLDQNEIGHLLPRRHQHFIPNAIGFIEDLEAQINRDETVGSDLLELEEISLYGDVLAKLRPMVAGMSMRYGVASVSVTGVTRLATTYRSLPRVMGNRRALDCVFRNLVDNCVKYSNPEETEGRIHIAAAPAGGSVIVRVEDNGIGIAQADSAGIFEDGFRGATARARRPQGLGRGLHDCRVLMHRMGGEIRVVTPTHVSEGTAFEVVLQQVRGRTT